MPTIATTLILPRSVSEMFTYFARPQHVIELSRPELNMQLVSGPEQLHLGAQTVFQAERLGITQQMMSEVTHFEPDRLIVLEQRKGPFRQWIQKQQFTATENGTQLEDCIDFEPPGGILGLMVSADWIKQDLLKMFAYREGRLREMFGAVGNS